MKQTLLAKRYAKALFDLGIEENILEKLRSDMELVAVVLKENRELRRLLSNPVITPLRKNTIIKSVFVAHVDKITLAFLGILVRKGREQQLAEIAVQFAQLYLDHKNIAVAGLVTATEINPELRNRIIGILRDYTSKQIEVIESIDAEIIGGFKLKLDDYQYDASISNIIKKLHMEFDKNLFIKGF